jgi:hypothetical protein
MSAKNKFSQEKYGPELDGKRALFLYLLLRFQGPKENYHKSKPTKLSKGINFSSFDKKKSNFSSARYSTVCLPSADQ